MEIAQKDLKRDITRLVLSSRLAAGTEKPMRPRFIAYDEVLRPDGSTVVRKKVILMTKGCSVPTCTMCPFTNENLYGVRGAIELLTQTEEVLARQPQEPDYELLALYNDGNFFAPAEIPLDQQFRIAELVARSGVTELVVESLPQFITRERLAPFIERLGPVRLEVGIGLQSADSFIREICVNTSFGNESFDNAVHVLNSLGASVKTYLMIKPPFLTEPEAIYDALGSLDYLRRLGLETATLCPTRIARNTLAHRLYEHGLYVPPNLWSIVKVIRAAHSAMRLRVACINLRGSDFDSIFPDSCPQCADAIVDGLEHFSLSGSFDQIPDTCACRQPGSDEVRALNIAELTSRVRSMIETITPSADHVVQIT